MVAEEKNLYYLHEVANLLEQLLIYQDKKQKISAKIQKQWEQLYNQTEGSLIWIKQTCVLSELEYFGVLVGVVLEVSTQVQTLFQRVFSQHIPSWHHVLLLAQNIMPINYIDLCTPVNETYWNYFYQTGEKDDQFLHDRLVLCHPWIITYALYEGIMDCPYLKLETESTMIEVSPEVENSFLRYLNQGAKALIHAQDELGLIQLCNGLRLPICHIFLSFLPDTWNQYTIHAFCTFFQRMTNCVMFLHCRKEEELQSNLAILQEKSSVFFVVKENILPKDVPVFHFPYTINQEKPHPHIPFVKQYDMNQNLPSFIVEPSFQTRLDELIFLAAHQEEVAHTLSPDQIQKGISILFHGPSGGGKTLCAKWMAKTIQKPLWQIDLSNVMDKYIGESEKHLEEIFHEAQRHDVILLFDEADSLFTKRTSVTNSNDRYANAMTSYLLQRMEQYPGIMILTSNFLHNFDDAFLRRMIAILRFQEASIEQREKKWKAATAHLPTNAIAWKDIAQVKLSYARIDQCLFVAVGLMLKDQATVLTERYLKQAIYYELQKTGEQPPSWWRMKESTEREGNS